MNKYFRLYIKEEQMSLDVTGCYSYTSYGEKRYLCGPSFVETSSLEGLNLKEWKQIEMIDVPTQFKIINGK